MAKEVEYVLGEHLGEFLLLSHSPDGGVSFLLPYGHPKDDPEAMHHKTLQAM